MSITINVVGLNPAQVRCTWYNIMWCSLSVSWDKIDRHERTEILLKEALNTIILTPYLKRKETIDLISSILFLKESLKKQQYQQSEQSPLTSTNWRQNKDHGMWRWKSMSWPRTDKQIEIFHLYIQHDTCTFAIINVKRLYDFRSSPPVLCKRARVLFTLFVIAFAYWCPTHIVLCFLLRLVYLMLPVSLYCSIGIP